MKNLFFLFSVLFFALLILPFPVFYPRAEETGEEIPEPPAVSETSMSIKPLTPEEEPQTPDARILSVILAGEERKITMHEYLIGVVLGELPAGFSYEVKRAQAVAARTYLLYRQEHGYILTGDGCACTAYLSPEEAEKRLGTLYASAREEAERAVTETDGEVLICDGELCCTVYHAMSWEKTEDASHIFEGPLPYLVSVSTPEDRELAGMETEQTFTREELSCLLSLDTVLPVRITENNAGRAQEISFGGTVLDAGDVRMLLGLRSTDITVISQDASGVTFRTMGYGHGVGMSQEGAQTMALSGSGYREILMHYYSGASILSDHT